MAERSFYHCFASKSTFRRLFRLHRTHGKTRDFETLTTTTIKQYPHATFQGRQQKTSFYSVYMVDFDIFILLSWKFLFFLDVFIDG